jgi:hypothetical protein
MDRKEPVWGWIVGVLVFGAAAPALGADEPVKAEDIPAVRKVDDQSDAIREARRVDLPLLDRADRVVIEESKQAGGRRVTLTKRERIREVVRALKTRAVAPSGGLTAVTLRFYPDGRLLRKAWVFEGGEWGFERPGTSWTTGRERELWKVIQRRLQ